MAAPTAPVMNYQCKAYRNTGTYGSPTWVLFDNMGSVKINDERGEVEIPLRSEGMFEGFVAGRRKLSIEWDMLYDPADASQNVFRAAYDTESQAGIDIAFMDAAIATPGSSGLRGTWVFTKCTEVVDDLGKPMMTSCKIAPRAGATNKPERFVAS